MDFGALHAALETQLQAVSVTPKLFMHNINRTCEQQPQHIVLPEGAEPRVLRAAAEVTRKGLARITLLGELAAIRAEAARISVDISQARPHGPLSCLSGSGSDGNMKYNNDPEAQSGP